MALTEMEYRTTGMMIYIREVYCSSMTGKYGVEFLNDLMLIQKVEIRITKIPVPNLWHHDKQVNNPHFTMLLKFVVEIYMHQGTTFSDGVPCQKQRFRQKRSDCNWPPPIKIFYGVNISR